LLLQNLPEVVNVEKEQVEPKENYTMFIFNWNISYGIGISILVSGTGRLIMKGLHTIERQETLR
jgi:hypothetical protein